VEAGDHGRVALLALGADRRPSELKPTMDDIEIVVGCQKWSKRAKWQCQMVLDGHFDRPQFWRFPADGNLKRRRFGMDVAFVRADRQTTTNKGATARTIGKVQTSTRADIPATEIPNASVTAAASR
jgi:hypothetical protein